MHPGALPMVFDFLRQASRASQVPVTTHSPAILDLFDPDRDTLLVVDRVDGRTEVRRAGEAELEPVRRRLLRLGDLFASGHLQLSLFPEAEE